MDMWSLESGGQINVIYIHLEKAFDKITPKSIISKLYLYKIKPAVIKWIAMFLVNRRQWFRINGFFYFRREVLSGLLRILILGPLLFIIFIND